LRTLLAERLRSAGRRLTGAIGLGA
jgi:hypothetical protein